MPGETGSEQCDPPGDKPIAPEGNEGNEDFKRLVSDWEERKIKYDLYMGTKDVNGGIGGPNEPVEEADNPSKWSGLLGISLEGEFTNLLGSNFLVKKSLAKKAMDEGIIELPADIMTVFARGYGLIKLGCLNAGWRTVFGKLEMQATKYSDIFNNNDENAQKAIDELNVASKLDDKKTVNVILNMFQSLEHEIRFDGKDKNPGHILSILILVEQFYSITKNTLPRETCSILQQEKVRQEVLVHFKKVFLTPGTAENLLLIVEMILKKIYTKLIEAKAISLEYIAKAEAEIRPTLVLMCTRLNKNKTHNVPAVPAQGRNIPAVPSYNVSVPRAPNIRCDNEFTDGIAKIEEIDFLKKANVGMASLKAHAQLDVCADQDLVLQAKKVKSYVTSMYDLEDRIEKVMSLRRSKVRDMCTAHCQRNLNNRPYNEIYKDFNKTLFSLKAAEFWRENPDTLKLTDSFCELVGVDPLNYHVNKVGDMIRSFVLNSVSDTVT